MARVAVPLIAVIALGAGEGPAAAAPGDGFQGENATPQDLDARAGARSPSSRQRTLVTNQGAKAKWNRFGTPRSLTKAGRYLATGLPTDPLAAART
jgi:extracellular elastinolytic metalloproteinase